MLGLPFLEMSYPFRKQEKSCTELGLATMKDAAFAESCVSLKTAVQKVSRIVIDLSRCHRLIIYIALLCISVFK